MRTVWISTAGHTLTFFMKPVFRCHMCPGFQNPDLRNLVLQGKPCSRLKTHSFSNSVFDVAIQVRSFRLAMLFQNELDECKEKELLVRSWVPRTYMTMPWIFSLFERTDCLLSYSISKAKMATFVPRLLYITQSSRTRPSLYCDWMDRKITKLPAGIWDRTVLCPLIRKRNLKPCHS